MRRRAGCFALTVALAASPTALAAPPQDQPKDGDRRPKLVLRATPLVAAAPARVVLTAELVGGADDFEEYYCASTQWEWGDDTSSESNVDCPPYAAGKSQIKRRFTVEHVFRRAGNYRVMFHLRQRSRRVATAMANLQIRPGIREF